MQQQTLKRRQDESKIKIDEDNILIAKIKILDQVLSSYLLDGKEENREFIPNLNTSQRKIVTNKLLSLIEKL